ncbi:MAG: hypothetical protein H6Q73_1508 [Firmicutes bacterium]|nr:hypothetical protein [Bacillota bacterium]
MLNTKLKRLTGGLVAGCLVLSLSGYALAQSNCQAPPPPASENLQPPPDCRPPIENNLKKLVNDRIITQAQADKVLAFFNEKAKKRQANCDKMKNMTPEERQAFMDKNRKAPEDLIRDLAKKANLTKEQAQTVADALRPPMHPGMQPPPPPNMQQNIEASLKKLVNNTVITQAQSDSILTFLKEKAKNRQADFDKMKSMPPEDRHTFMEKNRKAPEDLIRDLAQKVNLTEDQAKAVADALRPPMPPGMQPPPPPDAPPIK